MNEKIGEAKNMKIKRIMDKSPIIVPIVIMIAFCISLWLVWLVNYKKTETVNKTYHVVMKTYEITRDIRGDLVFNGYIITNETVLITNSPVLYKKICEEHEYMFIIHDGKILEVKEVEGK